MAAMLCNSVIIIIVAIVRTRLRAILLAMITVRKSTHGFPFLSYMSMGLHLVALWGARALLSIMSLTEQRSGLNLFDVFVSLIYYYQLLSILSILTLGSLNFNNYCSIFIQGEKRKF